MPEVGSSSVISILIVVVLPAPFGPSRPKSSPSPTSKLTPRTASTSSAPRRKIAGRRPVGPPQVACLDDRPVTAPSPVVVLPGVELSDASISRRSRLFSCVRSFAVRAEAISASFAAWASVDSR